MYLRAVILNHFISINDVIVHYKGFIYLSKKMAWGVLKIHTFSKKLIWLVNDRTAKNVVRPNPNGSAISTERSAEQFGRTSSQNNANLSAKN